jgi:hypothetical protein
MTERAYSVAFEKLVDLNNVDDDVVGLLAYSYYKRDKRELAIGSDISSAELASHHKMLTEYLVRQYRESALLRLEAYATDVLERAKPELQEQTRVDAINSAKIEIIEKLTDASVWWRSILWNLIAWLLSLAITFIILASTKAVTINIG